MPGLTTTQRLDRAVRVERLAPLLGRMTQSERDMLEDALIGKHPARHSALRVSMLIAIARANRNG